MSKNENLNKLRSVWEPDTNYDFPTVTPKEKLKLLKVKRIIYIHSFVSLSL